jgi:YARHG domain
MKHKRVQPALAVPVLATALFFALLPVQAQEPASIPSAPGFKTSFDRPLYYTGEITPADLVGRTLWELTLLRNTIYARASNTFRKKWLADYFNAQPWYHPLPAIDESKRTPLEQCPLVRELWRFAVGPPRLRPANDCSRFQPRVPRRHEAATESRERSSILVSFRSALVPQPDLPD